MNVRSDRRLRAYECPRCRRQVFLSEPADVPRDEGWLRHALVLHLRHGCPG